MNYKISYGTETPSRLRKVLLHNPLESLEQINIENYQYHLFNDIPKIDMFLKEHEQYADILKKRGIDTLFVRNFVNEGKKELSKFPNLHYLHDTAVITNRGAILSKMCPGTRFGEEQIIKEVLVNLGIPIFYEFENNQPFESCLILSPEILIIAKTQRHSNSSIEAFIPNALEAFEKIIYIEAPLERRFMHADMVFGKISEDLAVYFPKAFLKTYLITKAKREEIDFKAFLATKNIELIEVDDYEQKNWGCSFVLLSSKVILNYDISLGKITKNKLKQRGVDIIEFHPEALLSGGGSLCCLTLELLRD